MPWSRAGKQEGPHLVPKWTIQMDAIRAAMDFERPRKGPAASAGLNRHASSDAKPRAIGTPMGNDLSSPERAFYELRFKNQFLETKGNSFQELFCTLMSKVYPGDFVSCRPWGQVGDRKNDGYLKSERTLFQVYAPNEIKVSTTLRKVDEDFKEAIPFWGQFFDTWVFVHNAQAGLPPDVIAKLLELERAHSPVKVVSWGFEELLSRFRQLERDALTSLYGALPSATDKSAARSKAKDAQELVRSGKHPEAIQAMVEALAIARTTGDEEEEVEILSGLALLSSSRRLGGDQEHYLREAEKKADKLKSPVAKAIYLRARATTLERLRDVEGADAAYRAALKECEGPDDEKRNLATQACVIRSEFVHFLCTHSRFEEAQSILASAEDYARQQPAEAEGELFQAALEAGIHWSVVAEDHDGAIRRIRDLESYATTSRLAYRIGGDLLNVATHASRAKSHAVALAAAQASIRLGRQSIEYAPSSFLVGALYSEAMVMMQSGDHATALAKAEAILDLCKRPEDASIRQATLQLIAEIRRAGGDAQAAVDMATTALASANDEPENIAFSKLAVARALNDNGQTEDALKQAREAWMLIADAGLPARAAVDVLGQIANYASQLGADEALTEATNDLDRLSEDEEKVRDDKAQVLARAFANQQLRERLLAVLNEPDTVPDGVREQEASLRSANAEAVKPLLRWWDDNPEHRTAAYDFWGRGSFARILGNTRNFPNSFNVSVEVRSLDDVRRSLRLWGLYADFLMLVWKGPTKSSFDILPIPGDYCDPGGWGYVVAAGTTLKRRGSSRKWYPALAHRSLLPDDVGHFLAHDARPFLSTGRLIVVPAVGAGCFSPGHGPFEQLLSEAANAVPTIRWRDRTGLRIGAIPHSPDAPFEVLAGLANEEEERLRKLRLLLLRRSRECAGSYETEVESKLLALEIDDALRDFEARHGVVVRKRGFAHATESLGGGTARFRSDGRKLSKSLSNSPFAPLFLLQGLGSGWRVESSEIPRLAARFEPQEGDVIGTWLASPRPGWTIPTVRLADAE